MISSFISKLHLGAMGGDWQELFQTVVIGLIFSYLLAKLISTVVSFREENFKVVRDDDVLAEEESSSAPSPAADSLKRETPGVSEGKILGDVNEEDCEDEGKNEEEDEDGWEGVESTELDEVFSAATAFVAATASDRSSRVSSDVQLQLYGLYKIATEGPCTVPQPSAFKITARAKWNAWHGLGAMPTEEAMEKYIEIVMRLYPDWGSPSASKTSKRESGNESKGPVGPVFSSFVHEEASDDELKLEVVHVSAREGKAEDLVKHLENGISVNLRDSDERTPLHWAVDRGHPHVVDILISNGADINAKDNEGQTPLHYAALCEREAVARILVENNADVNVKDKDGNTPADLAASSWNFMTCIQ